MSNPERSAPAEYTDPSVSTRKSPLIEAANAAKVKGASIGGFISLLAGVGMITASQAGALNLALAVALGAIPVVAVIVTNLTTAYETVRKAWSKVTPVDDAVRVIDGQPVALVPATTEPPTTSFATPPPAGLA